MAQEDPASPTAVLANDIGAFIVQIESLRATLPPLMRAVKIISDENRKSLQEFVKSHAREIPNADSPNTFSIKFEDLASLKKHQRKIAHSTNASRLLPRHFVISLVSQYDSFLGRVIRFMFSARPDLLNASEKHMKYSDLVQFTSLDEARDYVIEKEVESVIRKSHAEHFAWLTEKLKIPFNKDLRSWPNFIELSERRNLYVHCDGRISSQYLQICAEHKCSVEPGLSVGSRLGVSSKYFEDAYKCVYEIAFKLAHVIWRKLCPNELAASDQNINDATYGLLEKGENDLALRLLDFFSDPQRKHSDEQARRIMVLNRAQAYKWSNEGAKCDEILDAEDWSYCEDKFKLCVAVLRLRYDDVWRCMKRLKHSPEFHKVFYRDWPIFKELRKQEEFSNVYEQCYGEKFAAEATTEFQAQDDETPSATSEFEPLL